MLALVAGDLRKMRTLDLGQTRRARYLEGVGGHRWGRNDNFAGSGADALNGAIARLRAKLRRYYTKS
jgi:hypothetical protein